MLAMKNQNVPHLIDEKLIAELERRGGFRVFAMAGSPAAEKQRRYRLRIAQNKVPISYDVGEIEIDVLIRGKHLLPEDAENKQAICFAIQKHFEAEAKK